MLEFDCNKSVVEIAAELAHEVKNPLSLISANIDLLELSDTKNWYWKNYVMIRREIKQINDLMLNFIHFAQSGKKQQGPMSVFSLKNMLRELTDMYEELYRGIDFIFTCESDEVNICGDFVKIRQVIVNILKNAVESINEKHSGGLAVYKYPGDENPAEKDTIAIDISLTGEYAVLSVLDSGVGISGFDPDKVFQPFYTTKPGGSGLGLYLCKSFIEEHKGNLDISGETANGCLVTIKLPSRN